MKLSLKFLKRNKKNSNTFKPNSYSHLREKVKSDQNLIKKFQKIIPNFNKFSLNQRNIKKYLLITITIFFSTIIVIGLLSLENFKIKDIKIIGNNVSESLINDLYKKNIFTVSASGIESHLNNSIENVDRVIVRKVLPNKLEIEVKELEIKNLVYNYNGFFLLDANSKIIKSFESNFIFTDEEKNILEGKFNIDSPILQQEYLLSLAPEKVPTFDWSKVPIEEKNKLYDNKVNNANNKVGEYFKSISENWGVQYDSIPKIFFAGFEKYAVGQIFEPRKMKFTSDILEALNKNNLQVNKVEWLSSLTLQVNLDKNIKMLFSIDRAIFDQIFDLESVIWNNKLQENKTIDFRVDKISIK